MGIRLVYGLKTKDQSYLEVFYPSRRMAIAARERSVDYSALLFDPDKRLDNHIDFCRHHVAVLRGELPEALYKALEDDGIPVVNSRASTALAGDKMRCADFFRHHSVLHPDTKRVSLADKIAPLPCPFVAKPRYGRMGWGVRLIEDQDGWNSLLESGEFKDNEYIAQEYIAASKGIDIRFFFAAFDCRGVPDDSRWRVKPMAGRPGTASICVTRRSPGFSSNAHTGGTMEYFEPAEGMRAEAERIFIASALDYGTIDFLVGDPGWTRFPVCEINANPGFEELERVSGLDVAGAIVVSALSRNTTGTRLGGAP